MPFTLKEKYHSLSQEQRLHQCPVPIIALTGGIASGKSSASQYLMKRGLFVICADQLIKEIYRETETITYIKEKYPSAIQNEMIDFGQLRKLAFSTPSIRSELESFLYKKLPTLFISKVKEQAQNKYMIYDVPLLFEKDMQKQVDQVLTIYCPRELQEARLRQRDGITAELVKSMIDSQTDIQEKKDRSQFSIDNTGTLQQLEISLDSWVNELFEEIG